MKKILFFLFLIILILVVFGLGFYFGENHGKEQAKIFQPPKEVDFSLFWQAWNTIFERFPNREKLDIQKMIYGAISGVIESLDDPHTGFLTPDERKEFIKDMKGEFEGVGMEIGIREKQLQVIAPIKDSPADKAGLRAGDKILKIDNISTINMTTNEAVTLIRGSKGTRVVLTIFRNGWDENREVEIIRGIIKIPTLSLEIIEENIAHLKLYHFIERTEDDFRRVANEILTSPAEKIILDLRNNPGGYLNIAKNITGWFLERGQVVVIKDFSENRGQRIYRSNGPSRLLNYPIVILINQGTASGSEILAGALRDNRGIKIIGETSFGKGSVQELINLDQGASLKMTVANWLTPKKVLITNKGLKPDIIVEKIEDDIVQNRDPQLNKAIEILKKI